MKWSIAAGKLIGVLALVPLLAVLPAHAQEAKPFSNEQLEQMTAQVALYPDSLLAQLFMATTYPDDFAAAAATSAWVWMPLSATSSGGLCEERQPNAVARPGARWSPGPP